MPLSQPARAVWIEMKDWTACNKTAYCHSLRGLCGLKFERIVPKDCLQCHSLRGLCGLKCKIVVSVKHDVTVTACEGCVDWNICIGQCLFSSVMSQPARAVWIEMSICSNISWNMARHSLRGLCGLKLQVEGMDAAVSGHSLRGLCGLKLHTGFGTWGMAGSQPARAVWIEIM